MAKEIDAVGIPVVHLCTIITISKAVGANRIFPGIAIPHVTGFPDLTEEEEKAKRLELVRKALGALTAEVTESTIFK